MKTKKTKKFKFVDLFAGCGGLSLGLELAEFEPIFVNELNQSALETYLLNRELHFPLLRSKYNLADIKKLVESDGRLLTELIHDLQADYDLDIKSGDLDLLVGGPPCQGFSGLGHRRSYSVNKKQLPSNHLYQDMAFVISMLRPKIFLFENVAGLLSSRWSAGGAKGEIFRDVLKEFRKLKDYEIRWELVHASDYGVPQNRPRVLVVGINKRYLRLPSENPEIKDDASLISPTAVKDGWLPKGKGGAPGLEDLLSDLARGERRGAEADLLYSADPKTEMQKWLRTKGAKLLKKGDILTEQEYSNHKPKVREKFQYMLDHGVIPLKFKTKKFAQRVLPKTWEKTGGRPSITATSLADDYVHYSEPRTLTVREWARLQTFPDWYKFMGPRTTGGRRRAGDPSKGDWSRDVPKYTQIGNAVPVLLANELGKHFIKVLKNNEL